MKWKLVMAVLLWLSLAVLVHFASVTLQDENASPIDNTFRGVALLVGVTLFYPGMIISCFLPIRHGLPWFVADMSRAEICNDILYAFVIAAVVLKLRKKRKNL